MVTDSTRTLSLLVVTLLLLVPAPAQRPLESDRLSTLTTDELISLARQVRMRSGPLLLEPDARAVRAHRRLLRQEETGVNRILPRGRFVHAIEDRQGGAYWSFTERTHVYGGWSHIGFSGTSYSTGFAGGDTGVVLDVGRLPLASLTAERKPAANVVTTSRWELLTSGDSADFHRRARELELDDRAHAVVGNTYLLRAVGDDDLLVGFTVVNEDEYGQTIAWRVLKTFKRSQPRGKAPAPTGGKLAAAVQRLLPRLDAMTLADLVETADRIRALVHRRLVSVQDRQHPVLSTKGIHAARILRRYRYDHVTLKGERGPAYYSFATRKNDYDAEPDLQLNASKTGKVVAGDSATDRPRPIEKLWFETGFYGQCAGFLVDLGPRDLTALRATPQQRPEFVASEVWDLLGRDLKGADRGLMRQVERDARALGLKDSAPASVGHTYLLRAILPGEHDHLVAFTVLDDDGRGMTLAWRILRTWPAGK